MIFNDDGAVFEMVGLWCECLIICVEINLKLLFIEQQCIAS